ncbi:hypothetical protein ACROYT_G037774 [Oculina patagonica]
MGYKQGKQAQERELSNFSVPTLYPGLYLHRPHSNHTSTLPRPCGCGCGGGCGCGTQYNCVGGGGGFVEVVVVVMMMMVVVVVEVVVFAVVMVMVTVAVVVVVMVVEVVVDEENNRTVEEEEADEEECFPRCALPFAAIREIIKVTLNSYGTIAWVGGAMSVLCLVYIAVERYFAIIHPLRQHGRFTKRRLKVFVVLGWSFAILMQMHGFIEIRYYQPDLRSCKRDGNFGYVEAKVGSLAWMVLAGIVPVSIMAYMYSRVVHHLLFKPVENLEASQRATLRYRKQVTITLITVSVIYAVCWVPNLIAYVIQFWGGEAVVGAWVDKSGTLLVTLNSCINPVMYSMRMKSFREHLRDMLLCKRKQTAREQAAVVHEGPTTGKPINGTEESVRNTAAPTPSHFHQHLNKRWSRQKLYLTR